MKHCNARTTIPAQSSGNRGGAIQFDESQAAKGPAAQARKFALVAVLAAMYGTPLAALADGFVRSEGDASYLWQGARYERVDDHWKRADVTAANVDAVTVSGFVGNARRDNVQVPSQETNVFGSTAGDTRFNNGMTSN